MKKTLILLLCAVMLIAFAACAPKSEPAATEKEVSKSDTPATEEGAATDNGSGWKPSGAVTVIVPYGVGGGQDVSARIFAEFAEKHSGVTFVVDNRTGGSGTIGTTAIANAKPDGQTLGMFHNLSLYDQFVIEGVTYTEKSFVQLGIFCADSTLIVANKSLGVNNLKELVEKAKAEPGVITWGGPEFTSQTYPRMNVENAAGVQFAKMIFDGGAASLTAVAGDNCNVTSVFPAEYMAMQDNPDLIPIASTGEKRLGMFPDLPTMKEQGVDASFFQWRGYVAPAGVSAEVIAYYDALFSKVIQDPDFQKKLTDSGFDFIDKHGTEAATQYMEEVFNANKQVIIDTAKGRQ